MIIEESGTTPEGYVYTIILKYDTGYRNGYIGVFDDSILYKQGYKDEVNNKSISSVVDVHGGITYSGFLGRFIVGAENPWYFGFDCNNFDNLMVEPKDIERILIGTNHFTGGEIVKIMDRYYHVYAIMNSTINLEATVKSKEFVYEQCVIMSKQIKEFEEELNVDV